MTTFFRVTQPWMPGQPLTKAQLPQAFQQAMAVHQRGQLPAAQAQYERILQADPSHQGAMQMLGAIAAQTGNFALAVEWLDRVLALGGNAFELHNQRAYALQQCARFDEALTGYERALALQPRNAEAWNNHGVVLHALRRYEDALGSYDQAIELNGKHAQALFNKGNALLALKRRTEALASFDAAIAVQPDYAKAYINRGVALQELQRPHDALTSYERAVSLQPFMAEAHFNRGGALQALARLDDAIAAYDQAITIRADFADAHLFKSTALLLQGKLDAGWRSYEWRWKTEDARPRIRPFSQPQWSGAEPLLGKTILLHSEQGLGDVIQFCRYAEMVRQLGAKVVLEVHRPLLKLMQSLKGADTLVAAGEDLPDFDYHCPLLSLPLAFGTTLETISGATAYLNVSPEKVEHWQQRLGLRKGLRVGMVWSGNPAHAIDYNRSIPLSQWPAVASEGLEWISLQKDVRETDLPALQEMGLRHFGPELQDLEDTAALCQLMDVVVSVDTSVAHLSAAIGRPTWILLPFVPDWRWLLNRDDSPWYPTAKLYRQHKDGDWTEVLSRVHADLTQMRAPAH